jgi:hypothetical protein
MKKEDDIMAQVKKIYAGALEEQKDQAVQSINRQKPSWWCKARHQKWWIYTPLWWCLESGLYKMPVYCTKCGGCWPEILKVNNG